MNNYFNEKCVVYETILLVFMLGYGVKGNPPAQTGADLKPNYGKAGPGGDQAKYTTPLTTTVKLYRTTPFRESLADECDYLASYCMRAYRTGSICGRTLYYKYKSFTNYCLLDYVNCKEGFEVWQIIHMGECFTLEKPTDYMHYNYDNDYFLDEVYSYS